jgi:hypothetical protein
LPSAYTHPRDIQEGAEEDGARVSVAIFSRNRRTPKGYNTPPEEGRSAGRVGPTAPEGKRLSRLTVFASTR